MEGEEEAMTGLLQLRLMILSASDSSPKQATWDNRPAKSFCRLHNVATRPKSQKESFRLLHIVQYIKKIIYKCNVHCSQVRRMLHHHWLVVDSLQPWFIIGPRSSYRPSRRQLIVSSPQTFLSWIKISPNFFELNKNLPKLFWVE